MRLNKNIQILLFLLIGLILFYSYYYLPSQNKGFIKVEDIEKGPSTEKSEVKNTFTNTEYKSQDEKGRIYTTKAVESYIYQNQTDLIHLVSPYSFTRLEKDQSLIEIRSKIGLFDKTKKNNIINGWLFYKKALYIVM